jgi:peptidoglycan/xylan/chitin deacetylase (PgdA/CDA1 family)
MRGQPYIQSMQECGGEKKVVVTVSRIVSILLALAHHELGAQTGRREIAITFDDLPVASVLDRSTDNMRNVTQGLLAALRRQDVRAVGFVNERWLEPAGALDSARLAVLADWIHAGHELGNHSYSHVDLHTTAVADFQADALRGERHTRALSARLGSPFRYFRHPFLHTGRAREVQEQMAEFLGRHRYVVAPVTIDNYDYLFSAAWERSRARGDTLSARRIREAYVAYMDTIVGFYERQSTLIAGRLVPQVLLLHANPLNAVAFDDVAAMLRRRGYAFVTLERALRDPAYASKDEYVGPAGISWLHRWALTARLPTSTYRGEPEVPEWVKKNAADPGGDSE